MESRMGQAWARCSVLEGGGRTASRRISLRSATLVRLYFPCCRKPDGWINLPGMKDFELYQQILGLVEPWRVESVTLSPRSGKSRCASVLPTPFGMPAVSTADADSRLRRVMAAAFGGRSSRPSSCRGCPMCGVRNRFQRVAVPWPEKYTRSTGRSSGWPLMYLGVPSQGLARFWG